jgi:PhzF family phenazine biosynthesis protein
MAVTIVQVDSFTDKPFGGNPAAVCILPSAPAAEWMQAVAREMNLSETAFLWPTTDGFRLRWFTPAAEVELCGHGTLASAHVLWEMGYAQQGSVLQFHTLSGVLTAEQSDGWIELDFPTAPPKPAGAPPGLSQALDCKPKYVGRSGFGYLAEVASEEILRRLDPASPSLMEAAAEGLIVTSRSEGDRYDFVSRVFVPALGVPEDPVTGSAHCTLGPYWSVRFGKKELMAYQASPRGGEVRVSVEGERVRLGGQAVTVLHCLLLVDPTPEQQT